jgi:hypothetical protein
MKTTFAFLLFVMAAPVAWGSTFGSTFYDARTGLTWSRPLPGVHAQFSADRECAIQMRSERPDLVWRAPSYRELNDVLKRGEIDSLGLEGHRYVWSSTPWDATGPKWWGRLLRLEDRTWVREADEYCYSVVCVADAR